VNIQIKYDEQYHALGLPLMTPPRAGDVGYDLYCTTNVYVAPQAVAKIPLFFSMALPDNYFALLQTRSSLAIVDVIVQGGVIDNGYRGMVNVVLANNGLMARRFTIGDRIAQMIILPMVVMGIEAVEALPPSARGDNGFGSTGK
jgi:dUTP pyrophosphatase